MDGEMIRKLEGLHRKQKSATWEVVYEMPVYGSRKVSDGIRGALGESLCWGFHSDLDALCEGADASAMEFAVALRNAWPELRDILIQHLKRNVADANAAV